jgi:hypothetical protein
VLIKFKWQGRERKEEARRRPQKQQTKKKTGPTRSFSLITGRSVLTTKLISSRVLRSSVT